MGQIIASITFDRDECYRCLGKGRLPMYGHIHGGVCFLCNGDGYKLTRAGAARRKVYDAILAERTGLDAADLQVGMKVRTRSGLDGWGTISSIDWQTSTGATIDTATGERTPLYPVLVHYKRGATNHMLPSTGPTGLRRSATPDDFAAVLAAFGRARTGFTVVYAD